jgi:hypothetical protein
MTQNEITAYNAGRIAAASRKMLPTYYTGNLAAAWKLGKLEAVAETRELTADEAGWVAIYAAQFEQVAA